MIFSCAAALPMSKAEKRRGDLKDMKHDERKLTCMSYFPLSLGIGGPANMEVSKSPATSALKLLIVVAFIMRIACAISEGFPMFPRSALTQ